MGGIVLAQPFIDELVRMASFPVLRSNLSMTETLAAIKDKYYELFRGKGRLSGEEEGEEMVEGEESEEEGGEPADGGQAGSSAQHAGQWG